MNNFRYMAQKMARNSLERRAVSAIRAAYPNVEQYISSHRYPTMPKIVLYSSAASSEAFLRNVFPFYTLVTPSATAETDEIITRRIAEQVTKIEDIATKNNSFGYIIRGFPFNINQALLLDRYLNGVNLAIYLKSASESADYANSIKPLLNYYDQRGSLLELSHSGESNLAQIEQAFEQIKIKIKKSS